MDFVGGEKKERNMRINANKRFINRGFPREADMGTSGPARLRASKPWSPPSRGITEDLSLSAIINSKCKNG
jgi:hypothetical protein